jgi:glycosyltransferase A (GT-A) superfamily protein (DUF2064 family)
VKPAVVLVVAKSPVAGRVKTRLGRVVGMERAAELAAAALLDTLAVCVVTYGVGRCHLALEGDLADGAQGDDLREAARGWTLHRQRGEDFANRLVNAHDDVATASGAPVVQVGMDTPHLQAGALVEAGARLTHRDDAVLGPAADGGWWLLGVGGVHLLEQLEQVPMSTGRTGDLTRRALLGAGARLTEVGTLRDVDEAEDAASVANAAPASRFARVYRELPR